LIRSFIDRLVGRKAQDVGGDWFERAMFGYRETHSGKLVNWRTALEVTAVLACARVIAEGVAQVPWRVMRQRAGGIGADRATDNALYSVLNRRPNSWQTSFEYRETMLMHLVLTNNHYSVKNRVRGEIRELIPVMPGSVTVTRNNDLSLTYRITLEDGTQLTLPQEDVWHVRGPSWNSWLGMEAVQLAREAIGLSMSLEETSASFQKNAARPSGVYSVEGSLTPEQYTKLVEYAERAAKNGAGKPFILDRNAKWIPMQLSGSDMQLLENRKFQLEEVARAMRVMPLMIGVAEKSNTYASAEQMFLAHVTHTLMPWYERIEQSADVNLLGVRDDTGLYTHLDPKALLRGAAKDRAAFYATALGAGGGRPFLTQDEVRDEEDYNPQGGDAAVLGQPLGTAPTPKPDKPQD
jgi:HK97 family phage portal protein